jgi:hypothetical protein
MLFRQADLVAIAAGEITVAFRRWRRPAVKAGRTLQTAAGRLAIDSVERVEPEAITRADLRRAGFADRAALLALLRADGDLYRIAFHVAGPDPRIALRARTTLDAAERADIAARLARLDGVSSRGVDRGDAARDRGCSGHARRRPRGRVRTRAAAVQGRRAQAQGARADREPRGRLPAVAARPRLPRRLSERTA